MLGKNKISRPVKYDGFFFVHSMFYTLQGEGIFAGHPAVFIRMSGCNLKCSFCDTEFDDKSKISTEGVVEESLRLSNGKAKLIVITGGEPLLQDIGILCTKLIKKGFDVQIETNGTIYRKLPKKTNIVCSPKIGLDNKYFVDKRIIKRVNAFKFIISKKHPNYNKVPSEIVEHKSLIYVQPMDEMDEKQNAKNIKYATKIALENGYAISLQLHKILNIE